MVDIVNVNEFGTTLSQITKTDRWVFLVIDGEMGEGKSCLADQLSRVTAKANGTPFSYKDNMTYSRKELKDWIDGEGEDHKNQKPEHSVLLPDELISMFFKRNWYDKEQIDGIELLNKCRDRHLVVIGNVPNFWDLDSAVFPLTTFWIHVHERGRAWVFQKDANPFVTDKWHRTENIKVFRKNKNPYKCEGFVCEIQFPDWTPEQRALYYAERNEKRRGTEGQRAGVKIIPYKNVRDQRDKLIKYITQKFPAITSSELSRVSGLGQPYISDLRNGVVGDNNISIEEAELRT